MSGGTALNTGHGQMFSFQGTGNVFHLKQRILALPKADPIKEFLKTLVFAEMNSRWHDISPAVDGDGHRLFWIEGGPGCGKSTLFKCLRDNHSTMVRDNSGLKVVVLSFFFHAQGIELQRSRLGLFRALLHQLVSSMPDLKASFLEQLREQSVKSRERAERNRGQPGGGIEHDNGNRSSYYDAVLDENGDENLNWHFTELKQFLSAFLIKASERRSIWIFVDAIDECYNEKPESLVQLFKSICQDTHTNRGGVRICFSSRDHRQFSRTYGYSVHAASENRNDINAYVHTKLSESQAPFFKEDPAIASFIAEEASGMFMWAQMITERILMPEFTLQGPDLIRAEIKHYLGKDLDNLYGEIVEDMRQDYESLCLIEWLTFCEKPLTLGELQWALPLHPDCSGDFESFSDARASSSLTSLSVGKVISLSRGLVEFSGDRFQFKHESMRDFFRDRGCARLRILCGINTSISPRQAKAEAYKNLTSVCLRYLKLMKYEASQQPELFRLGKTMKATALEKEFPLARYSTIYWTTHATQSELHTTAGEGHSRDHSYIRASLGHQPQDLQFWLQCLYAFSEDFNSVGQAISATNQRDPDRNREAFPRGKTNLIHIAARMGLAYLFHALIQESLSKQKSKDTLDFNTEDDYGYTVLHLAAVGGNEHTVKQIIDDHHFTKKPPRFRRTMYNDDFGAPVVECPLLMALWAGHGSVAQILLDHGRGNGSFDPSKISFGYSFGYSLRLRSTYAAFNMPEYIFNVTKPFRMAGALVEGEVESLQTRHREEKGSQIANFMRRKLQPVGEWLRGDLHETIFKNTWDLMDDMDFITTDHQVGNALHLMAENGSLEMVKILVASGRVDINATNPLGLTPLVFAAAENHDEIVDYLLQQGAMPYANDNYLSTPLFWALNSQKEGRERVIRALLRQEIPKNSPQIALHLTAAKLMGDDTLVESCVEKNPGLLRPFAQSLEKQTWPDDLKKFSNLWYDFIKAYETERVKERLETATDWVKESKSWLKSKW
ncbi:uncharacterized protein FFMR_00111 [Fusarium fujikuroi]|nr:uncharacterized protein FFMR_00111 [Fusarium fujikuroi]